MLSLTKESKLNAVLFNLSSSNPDANTLNETAIAKDPSLMSHLFFNVYAWLQWGFHTVEPWLTPPIVILFMLPMLLLVLVYCSALLFHLHQRHPRRLLRRLRRLAVEEGDPARAAIEAVANLWDIQGWMWFGYEVRGLDKLPTKGPALLLYYHGALPVDYYYLVAKVLLNKHRILHSVVDNFVFKVPGMSSFLNKLYCTPGTVEECAQQLVEGHIIGLAPGGVYEAQFGDEHYQLLWRQRTGFAKVAIMADKAIRESNNSDDHSHECYDRSNEHDVYEDEDECGEDKKLIDGSSCSPSPSSSPLLRRSPPTPLSTSTLASLPIFPVFTQNCREAFRTLQPPRSWTPVTRLCRWLYHKTRLPWLPIIGGLPVKLVTHIGDPILDYNNNTPEELKIKCQTALEKLIEATQKPRPGSVLSALKMRLQDLRPQ